MLFRFITGKQEGRWAVGSVLDVSALTTTDQYKTSLIKRLTEQKQSTHIVSTPHSTNPFDDEPQNEDANVVRELKVKIESMKVESLEANKRARQAEDKAIVAERQRREALEQAQVSRQEVASLKKALQSKNDEFNELANSSSNWRGLLASANSKLEMAHQLALRATRDSFQPFLVFSDEIKMSEQQIDKGAYGVTVFAKFRGLDVGAKCLQFNVKSEFEKVAFCYEMYNTIHVHHPNFQQIYATSLDRGAVVLVEAIPSNVKKELNNSPFSYSQFHSIAGQVASTLSYLHQHKPQPIVYQHLTSSTVLLKSLGGNNWRAKLAENGSANFISYVSPPESPPVNVYSAPEANLSDRFSPLVDTYSYGILLIEMATCKEPPVDQAERNQIVRKISWTKIIPLVESCIAPDPRQRPIFEAVFEQLKRLNK